MINILIADENIYYATNLMNYINKYNDSIRVLGITSNGKDTIEFLDNNNVDVFFLDIKMPIYNGIEILEKVQNKKKYIQSCIGISDCANVPKDFTNNNIVYSVLSKNSGFDKILYELNKILKLKDEIKNKKITKEKIIKELLFLGYDFSFKGTKYLIEVIEYIAVNSMQELYNLESQVYSEISLTYKVSIHSIKCNIYRATTEMYYRCEAEKLKQYFHLDKDEKPKTKTIINTIIYKINK